ncbi:hypothetical protein NDU88_005869 [Pleurodeles waltl]|uniref:Uncharacterized protein n=1 Tax=Pleurodeles waltl TaxID=8319 RepID=A0AAV7WZI5_PLEWA|nr:hypothetical protein NDU88_005869 [Pleurodeles waltl]
MFGVPRARNAERNPEQRKTATCEDLRRSCKSKEKLIGMRSGNRSYLKHYRLLAWLFQLASPRSPILVWQTPKSI